MPRSTPIATLAQRLLAESEQTRRLAVFDLIAAGVKDPARREAANLALLAHVEREGDIKSAVRIAEHFGATKWRPAMETLWRLYEADTTPVEIAHAAIVAHDRIAAHGNQSPE